ncbi:MAG TPA: hypothetical protein VLJ10_05300, partial [Candidatus Bathyarchaeia archaeon]|nr:hypothetical protein [Candidatus Bathyarchaeia archaeon]
LPAGLRVKNLVVRNVVEARDVRIYLRVPFLIKHQILIARLELIEPVFQLVRHSTKEIDFGGVYLREQERKVSVRARASVPGVIQGMRIDFLSIKDGRFEILDLTLAEPDQYLFDQIRLKAVKVDYPLADQNMKFDVESRLQKAGDFTQWKGAKVSMAGWMNWPARAIDAQIDFKGIDGMSAKVALKGRDNKVNVQGDVNLSPDPVDKEIGARSAKQEGIFGAAFGVLQVSGSQLALKFAFETTMDDFNVTTLNFQGDWNFPLPEKSVKDFIPAIFFRSDGKTDASGG